MRRLQIFSSPLSPCHRALIFSQAPRACSSSRKTSAPARPHALQQLSVAATEKLASASSTNNINNVSAWIAETETASAGEPRGMENVAFASPTGDDGTQQAPSDGTSTQNPMHKMSNALRLGAPSVTIHPPTPSAERAPSIPEIGAAEPEPKASSPTAVNSPGSEKDSVDTAFRSEPKLAESEVVTPDSGEQTPVENK